MGMGARLALRRATPRSAPAASLLRRVDRAPALLGLAMAHLGGRVGGVALGDRDPPVARRLGRRRGESEQEDDGEEAEDGVAAQWRGV